MKPLSEHTVQELSEKLSSDTTYYIGCTACKFSFRLWGTDFNNVVKDPTCCSDETKLMIAANREAFASKSKGENAE